MLRTIAERLARRANIRVPNGARAARARATLADPRAARPALALTSGGGTTAAHLQGQRADCCDWSARAHCLSGSTRSFPGAPASYGLLLSVHTSNTWRCCSLAF